jgi:putative DNA primase/helicase
MTTLLAGTEVSNRNWFEDLIPTPIKWEPNQEGRTKCPFPDHDDKNPSFSVNAEKGVFYCHGCQRQGHIWELTQLLQENATRTEPTVPAKSQGMLVQMAIKKSDYEHEYIYRNPDNEPHLLIGINGSGSKKTVHQYHYKDREWYKGGVKQQYPYQLQNIKIAIQNGQPIYIVEGEKDVQTLKGHHLVATTNAGGADKWPEDNAFNEVFENANVIILPDNDMVGKAHAQKIAQILKKKTKSIKLVELPGLPEKGDVTDWLETHSIHELHKIVNETSQFEESAPPNEGTSTAKKPEDFFDPKGQFQPVWLGKHLLEISSLFFHKGLLYIYENGVYFPKGEQAIRKTIQQLLGDRSRKHYIEEVLHWLKVETYLENEEWLKPTDGIINVKNGLLNWKTGELLPHTPKRLSIIQIPVKYDPNQSYDFIENFFREVVPEDTLPNMGELFGYCMIPSTKYQEAFMFTGEGANGKSTVIDLLTRFIGSEYVSNVSLQDLEKNRFKAAQLHGKLLNTFADLSHRALETSSMFKSIVGGDRISAEYKGKDAFDFQPFARLVFSANELPTSRDVTKGFFRRWRIVPFPYSFDSNNPNAKPRDPNLLEKLTTNENLSGLLNLALEGLRRLDKNGGFTENESTKQALEQYKKDSDNVALFLEEMCVQQPKAFCATKTLFAEYEIWSEESGLKPLGRKRFNKRLQEHIPTLEKKRQYQGPEVWIGVGLVHQY